VLPDAAALKSEVRPTLLNGVTVVTGTATALAYDVRAADERRSRLPRSLLHLGQPRARRDDRLAAASTSAAGRRFDARHAEQSRPLSGCAGPAINDGETRLRGLIGMLRLVALGSSAETVDMAFKHRPSPVQVYWFDDTGRGEVRVPSLARPL
jgi:hypothetical protein